MDVGVGEEDRRVRAEEALNVDAGEDVVPGHALDLQFEVLQVSRSGYSCFVGSAGPSNTVLYSSCPNSRPAGASWRAPSFSSPCVRGAR